MNVSCRFVHAQQNPDEFHRMRSSEMHNYRKNSIPGWISFSAKLIKFPSLAIIASLSALCTQLHARALSLWQK